MKPSVENGTWIELLLWIGSAIGFALVPFFATMWHRVGLLEQWKAHHIEKDDSTHDDIKEKLDELIHIVGDNHEEDVKGRRQLHVEVSQISQRLSRLEGIQEGKHGPGKGGPAGRPAGW